MRMRVFWAVVCVGLCGLSWGTEVGAAMPQGHHGSPGLMSKVALWFKVGKQSLLRMLS